MDAAAGLQRHGFSRETAIAALLHDVVEDQDVTVAEIEAQFGATVVRETIKRSGIEPSEIDQTIFGNAWQAGVGPNAARLSAVNGGVPVDAPAVSVKV